MSSGEDEKKTNRKTLGHSDPASGLINSSSSFFHNFFGPPIFLLQGTL